MYLCVIAFNENQWAWCVYVCASGCMYSMRKIGGRRKEVSEQFGGVEEGEVRESVIAGRGGGLG